MSGVSGAGSVVGRWPWRVAGLVALCSAVSSSVVATPAVAVGSAFIACTITGTAGDDVLVGTAGADVICGLGGNDIIDGDGGDDLLYGGDGDDVLFGGAGRDELHGGPGDDELVGGLGSDVMHGDGGGDTVSYDTSVRQVAASLDGRRNDGERGERDLIGVTVEHLVGGSGNDSLTGSVGSNILSGGEGDDVLSGLGGDDVLYGEEGADTLKGGDGRDVLTGGPGSDRLQGGAGTDLVSYADETRDVVASLDGKANDGPVAAAFSSQEVVTLADESDAIDRTVEGLVGGEGNDTLTGNDGENILAGGEGDDDLDGQGGGDLIDGGPGNNICRGLEGADLYGCDGSPPQIISSTITPPASIDTDDGDVTITGTMRITDDLSGVSVLSPSRQTAAEISHCASSTNQSAALYGVLSRTDGTALDGQYDFEIVIPRYSRPGLWTVGCNVVDEDGNASAHYVVGSVTLSGTSVPDDLEPPVLESFTLMSSPTVDTSTAKTTVVIHAEVTDDRSGIGFDEPEQPFWVWKDITCYVEYPGGNRYWLWNSSRYSGTPTDGVYEFRLDLYKHSRQGEYTFYGCELRDQAGNSENVIFEEPVIVTQTGPGDTEPPTLEELERTSPHVVNTAWQSATVTLRARATDPLAGLYDQWDTLAVYCYYRTPSGGLLRPWGANGSTVIVEGAEDDGIYYDAVYEMEFTLPRFSALSRGTYTLSSCYVEDQVSNGRNYLPEELAALGFDTAFVVQ
jgi:Ca2+-binding RTX toxin-like protein